MKKVISLALIFVMCLGILAGCQQKPAESNGLADAKEYLYAMYKDNDENTPANYSVVGVVNIDGVSYNITWAADSENVKIVAADKMYNVELTPSTEAEIAYKLTATIADDKGNTETVTFSYKIPQAAGEATSLKDGTYVILAGNLTMSSLTEDKSYGYPYATEVTVSGTTVSGNTAADVLTIKNVDGGVTIQDAYGRYFYLKGTYNSFNVDATAPAEGHIWEILKEDDHYLVVNALNKKTLAYSTSYTSWGCYPELTDDHNSKLNILAVAGGSSAPSQPSAPAEAQLPEVANPVEGTAYKFGMIQVKNDHTVYIAGGIDQDRYLITTDDKAAALDVFVEKSGSGYKFSTTIDGAKVYISLTLNAEGKAALGYNAEGTVFTYKADISSWATDVDGTEYYIGSYNNFDTMSASKTSYITAENAGISQFPAGFFNK